MIPIRKEINADDIITLTDGKTNQQYGITVKDYFKNLASGRSVMLLTKMIKALESRIPKSQKPKEEVKKKVK